MCLTDDIFHTLLVCGIKHHVELSTVVHTGKGPRKHGDIIFPMLEFVAVTIMRNIPQHLFFLILSHEHTLAEQFYTSFSVFDFQGKWLFTQRV